MAIQQTPQSDLFKQQLRDSLQRKTANARGVKISRHANVYTCGDRDEMVYFIESGQIKLLMLSTEGRECLLAIHGEGDIFGELCLSGLGARLETATAMQATTSAGDCPWLECRVQNGGEGGIGGVCLRFGGDVWKESDALSTRLEGVGELAVFGEAGAASNSRRQLSLNQQAAET